MAAAAAQRDAERASRRAAVAGEQRDVAVSRTALLARSVRDLNARMRDLESAEDSSPPRSRRGSRASSAARETYVSSSTASASLGVLPLYTYAREPRAPAAGRPDGRVSGAPPRRHPLTPEAEGRAAAAALRVHRR